MFNKRVLIKKIQYQFKISFPLFCDWFPIIFRKVFLEGVPSFCDWFSIILRVPSYYERCPISICFVAISWSAACICASIYSPRSTATCRSRADSSFSSSIFLNTEISFLPSIQGCKFSLNPIPPLLWKIIYRGLFAK